MNLLNEDNMLFYDIEVFKENAFVVFKDINKNMVRCFHNNFTGLEQFIKGKVLVGFNNYFYDDKILTYMLQNRSVKQIKQLNDNIISDTGPKMYPDRSIKSLDVFQQISVAKSSLKKIEGNMGKMILESSVDFTIDRALTDSEFTEALQYCCYDVDMVIEIWKKRKSSYFEPKMKLVERLGNPMAYKWNSTTISANLLVNKPMPKWADLRVSDDLLEIVPVDVKDLWLQVNSVGGEIKKKSITVDQFDNDIVFALGGIHSTKRGSKVFRDVILTDISSMYPATIVNNKILGQATKIYDEIRQERIRVKDSIDNYPDGSVEKIEAKTLSNALKLILNSVYGLLKNQYSTLFNPRASATVCVIGQIVLYELARRLSKYATICQLNTDGIMYQTEFPEQCQRVCEEWQKEFNYNLEDEYFDVLYQRDVNNYIAVEKDTGYLTVKGGDVKRYVEETPFDNGSLRIVDIAIVDYLVYGKDVIDTLRDNLDKPELYQYILQAGGTFDGTYEVTLQDGRYTEVDKHQKVNRVFACKGDGILLVKRKTVEGKVSYSRFPDTPDKMYPWNDECAKLENFKEIVDLNWYYKLIMKKLEGWR